MELLQFLIGPVVTAAVTAGSVWLRDVQQRRDREHRRRRAIEQATQELTLIDAWLIAHERLRALSLHAGLAQRVSHDLEKAYSVLADPVVVDPAGTEPARSRWSISSFLLRDVGRGWARLVRFVYYLLVLVAGVWSIAGFAVLDEQGVTVGNVLVSLFLAMLGVLPALGSYKLARRVDRLGLDPDYRGRS